MTNVSAPRPRSRGLKTWSSLGNLGRRPTEYEVLTWNMNHTTGSPALELGPDVNGNVWLREHRDGMRFVVPSWDAFRDPDQVTYGSYVAMQDDAETYVEGLLAQFDADGHDAALTAGALDLVARALTPCRFLGHGLQMLSAYVQQLAPSSFVATAATFQTADQLRRVQTLAYRTTQLARTHPDRGFGAGERATWREHPQWQPLRRLVETALVEYDWDRALVATQLVVKPVADLLLLDALAHRLGAAGAVLDGLVLENLAKDARRSQRFSTALARFVVDADPGNAAVLQEYLDVWAPLGHEALAAGARLVAGADEDGVERVRASVTEAWTALVTDAGLRLPDA
jgi:toluene monooxygenase system protein E